MKKTTLIIIIVIILMLLVIGVFAFTGNKKNENEQASNGAITNEIQNEQTNQVNEIENNEIENKIENEAVENKAVENKTSTETFEESPKTAQEKAITIVKKDWKGNNNTEFSVEGMDANGNYIVTVRNSKTTEALAFYTVNVSNGTFTKEVMN